jgi:hypothetical protein
VENEPVVIYADQLALPKEKQFADNSYTRGLIDFNKLGGLVTENVGFDPLKMSNELDIDPITKEKYDQHYKLEYAYYERNKKTYINRWSIYNPSVKMHFNYDDADHTVITCQLIHIITYGDAKKVLGSYNATDTGGGYPLTHVLILEPY